MHRRTPFEIVKHPGSGWSGGRRGSIRHFRFVGSRATNGRSVSVSTPELPRRARPVFATTRWTQVVRAQGGDDAARAALSELCATYYVPVEAFIRGRLGPAGGEVARDLTQEFFARLLAGSGVDGADASRGHFRSYLLGAVKHFLQTQENRRLAAKRGGGVQPIALVFGSGDTEAGEIPWADRAALSPDVLFDQRWARTVLERALAHLEADLREQGKQRWFEVLKPALQAGCSGAGEGESQRGMAASLGISESAVKVAIHRLRKRFRAAVKAEIGETLLDPATVEEEMRHLVQALTPG